MSWDEDIAWAAGFYEGEGSVTLIGGRLALQIKNNDPQPLATFRAAVQAGTIYGPYGPYPGQRLGRNPFWVWVAHQRVALSVLRTLAPWLSRRRLGQGLDALAAVRGPAGSEFDLAYSWLREVHARASKS